MHCLHAVEVESQHPQAASLKMICFAYYCPPLRLFKSDVSFGDLSTSTGFGLATYGVTVKLTAAKSVGGSVCAGSLSYPRDDQSKTLVVLSYTHLTLPTKRI